jgi:hypothetical protein
MATFPAVLPCPIFALLIVLQKVLRRFKSLIFRFGISTVRGRAHGPDPDQLLSNARSLFGNPWRLWLQIAC